MLERIVALLSHDAALISLLGRAGTTYKWLYFRETTDAKRDCILYDYVTTRHDGIVERGRLTLTIICEDITVSRAVEQRLRTLLITPDDRPSVGGVVLKCVQNGGGSLTDTTRKKVHTILYLDVSGKAQKGY
jgi:hypothetical protein